jgi:tRNA threonylcarbamoyladenosine biosynthesis protein TsaB
LVYRKKLTHIVLSRSKNELGEFRAQRFPLNAHFLNTIVKCGLTVIVIMKTLNKSSVLLAIETATPVCSVALRNSDGRIVEKRIEGKGVHSERTFLFIKELFDRSGITVSGLDAILFSNGPGSYTGLRIGAAAVKGLLFGRDVEFFTYPTLLSFAAAVLVKNEAGTIHSVIDARREHLYWQSVVSGGGVIGDPQVIELSDLKEKIEAGDTIVGTGWERLEIDPQKKVTCIGSEGISAVNLIHAFDDKSGKRYFVKEDPKSFVPEYLTMSQINNSVIEG